MRFILFLEKVAIAGRPWYAKYYNHVIRRPNIKHALIPSAACRTFYGLSKHPDNWSASSSFSKLDSGVYEYGSALFSGPTKALQILEDVSGNRLP